MILTNLHNYIIIFRKKYKFWRWHKLLNSGSRLRSLKLKMPKDLFIIDTRCHLNHSIEKAFIKDGFEVHVSRETRHFDATKNIVWLWHVLVRFRLQLVLAEYPMKSCNKLLDIRLFAYLWTKKSKKAKLISWKKTETKWFSVAQPDSTM